MKDETIRISRARAEDLREILDLQRRAFETEAQAHGNYDIEPLRQSYDSILADFDTHAFLKAVHGEKIVGSVKCRALEGRVWIGKLIVEIAHRGKGLGKRLLAEAEALHPEAEKFQLITAASSTHNIRLYESVGYRVRRRYPDPAQDGFPMVEMVKANRPESAPADHTSNIHVTIS